MRVHTRVCVSLCWHAQTKGMFVYLNPPAAAAVAERSQTEHESSKQVSERSRTHAINLLHGRTGPHMDMHHLYARNADVCV